MKVIEIAISQIGVEEIPRGSNWGDAQTHMSNLGINYPKVSGVYKIKCLLDNKVYIGSSININKRIKNHIWKINNNTHRNVHLTNAIKKYGWDSFFFIVIETCEQYELKEREQFWIDKYASYKRNKGYNKQQFAYSNIGNSPSLKTRRLISKSSKGIPKTADHNYKNSIAHKGDLNHNYGKPISEKLRLAIVESNKRRALK